MSLLLLLFFISIFCFLLKRVLRVFYWSCAVFGVRQTWQSSCEILGLYLYLSMVRRFDISDVSEFSFSSGEVSLIYRPEDGTYIILSKDGIPAELMLDFTHMSYLMNRRFSWQWTREDKLDGEVMYYRYATNNGFGIIPVILTYASLLHYFNLRKINTESSHEYVHWGMGQYCRPYLHGDNLDQNINRNHLPK